MITSSNQLLLALVAALGLAPSAEPASDIGSPAAVVSKSAGDAKGAAAVSAGAASPAGSPAKESSDRSSPPSDRGAADTSRPRPAVARVLFITTKDCPRCDFELSRLRKTGADFDKLRAAGWKIGETADNHLQVVDRDVVAELVEQLKVRQFPTVAAVIDGQIVRSFQAGCTTPLDAWTFGFLAKGIDERPPGSVPEVARVETTGHYPLRGNHWSIDDDWNPTREKVLSHLRGPVHGGHTARYPTLETWSFEELRSLHDNIHEQEMGGVSFANSRYAAPASNPFSASRKTLGH